jgi:RNA polymerase sigma factor (sigma-70 family)
MVKGRDFAASAPDPKPSDRELDRLLDTDGAALRRLARAYTQVPADAEDLFQEIVIAIWRALPMFRGEASERTFIFRIAHNRAISYAARRRRAPAAVEVVDEPRDNRPDPERQLRSSERGERLLRGIRRLPFIYRQVIMLTLEDMSYAEIANVMGISESNVGVRLNRARQMLRQELHDE